jgi:Ca2+-binding RTX toxin-like protein
LPCNVHKWEAFLRTTVDGVFNAEPEETMAILIGSPLGETLAGTGAHDIITGAGGNDTITGAAGADLLDGGDRDDTINGNAGDDFIVGDVAFTPDPNIFGIDTINGGAGDDVIVGGPADDVLTGGPGADLFIFQFGQFGFDRITDFQDGVDRLATPGATNLDLVDLPEGANFSFDNFENTGVLVEGVAAANLTAADFLFGQL